VQVFVSTMTGVISAINRFYGKDKER